MFSHSDYIIYIIVHSVHYYIIPDYSCNDVLRKQKFHLSVYKLYIVLHSIIKFHNQFNMQTKSALEKKNVLP